MHSHTPVKSNRGDPGVDDVMIEIDVDALFARRGVLSVGEIVNCAEYT